MGGFLICDFQFIPSVEDGLVVEVEPGTYAIEAKGIDYVGDRRVSRLRVFQRSGTPPTLGKKIGETWTDTACSAVCDLDRFTKEWNALGEDAASDKLQEEYGVEDCGIFRLSPQGSSVPYVTSGFGDGAFPVFELCSGLKRVGFEIEFIAAGESYPFEPRDSTVPSTPAEQEQGDGGNREGAWNKIAEVLQSYQKSKTGDKAADRRKLEELFAGVNRSMEDEFLAAAENLRNHRLQVRMKALPLHVTYTRVADETVLKNKDVQERANLLTAAGYTFLGIFRSSSGANVTFVGFIEPPSGLRASIGVTKSRIVLMICANYQDGVLQEFTEMADPGDGAQPAWFQPFYRPGLSTAELIQFAAKNLRDVEMCRTTADNYAAMMEREWHRHVAWRAEVGGMTKERLKTLLRLTDSLEDQEKLAQARCDEADKALFNWLRLQPSLPFQLDDVLNQLVVIHDDMAPASLAAAWWCGTKDVQVKEQSFVGPNPRESFAKVNQERGNKLRLVLEKRTGYPADYYLPTTP